MDSNKETIDIIIKYIPDYLKNGEFYKTLLSNNDDYEYIDDETSVITIPIINYKYSPTIFSYNDFINLLHTFISPLII